MADPLIDFSPGSVTFSGRLFEGSTAVQLKDVVGREVQKLAKEGQRLVKAQIKTENGTGYTRAHIVVKTKAANALYASVRMDDEKNLPPRVQASRYSNGRPNPKAGQPITGGRYAASRVPFIVLSVLESGRYGGRHINNVRVRGTRATSRRKWQHSASRRQPAQFFFRRTAKALAAKTPAIRDAITARFAR